VSFNLNYVISVSSNSQQRNVIDLLSCENLNFDKQIKLIPEQILPNTTI